jgi:diaminohydroxyphosphoribosylaminopyrimidine deaminase/5-amino-6-(5-phosphoribosylamino)uracil reductase
MRLAIALSAFGLGTTSPNPPVGCVILDEAGQIVGQGYHHRKGEAHAEVNALKAAGERAKGGTAVVTLEPCNHSGTTPPCHQALIDAEIRRVVVAVIDPTSRGVGGVARLRQAGVDVEVGILEAEARLVLGPWLTALASRRSYLIWPYVVSSTDDLQGLAAVPDVDDLRQAADAVLRTDGVVEEAAAGSHGYGVLDLRDLPSQMPPGAMAGALYEAGARIALLDGSPQHVEPFLENELIHRVVAYLPVADLPSHAEGLHPQRLLPDRFRVQAIRRVGGYVRVDGVHGSSSVRPVVSTMPG